LTPEAGRRILKLRILLEKGEFSDETGGHFGKKTLIFFGGSALDF
jgi:hypothetical protein